MNKESAISVIVPVYKAENYLHRCVDSLLAQTFSNFELILIDDGSPDRSGEICDEYALKDSRVRVFHKENGGVSTARQHGVDCARGEYMIHADPDDWVEANMLEELYRKAREEDADMVICDFYEEFLGKQRYVKQQPSALNHETVLHELLFQQLHGSCWNKLVRLACYNMYEIRFPKLIYCEDLSVNISLLNHPLKISYLNRAFYHYDRSINPNSITVSDRKSLYRKLDAFCKYLPSCLDRDRYQDGYVALEYRLAFTAIIARVYSFSQYLDRFKWLRRFIKQKIYTCSNWEKSMVVLSLYGGYPAACLLVEVRHVLGRIKRYIYKAMR